MSARTEAERLEFSGESGRKPQTEARRYVYRVIAAMLDNEVGADWRAGWMFGGIEREPDQRRLRKAIKAVRVEMLRKGGGARVDPLAGMRAVPYREAVAELRRQRKETP